MPSNRTASMTYTQFVAAINQICCSNNLRFCRSKVAALEKENQEMREDLQAVDPEFFAQIEDLKYAYHVLKQEHAELQEQTRLQPGVDLLQQAAFAV